MAECRIPDASLHRLLSPAGETILAVPLSRRRAPPLRSCPDDATAFKRETSDYLQTFDPQRRPHNAAPGRPPADGIPAISPLLTDISRPASVDIYCEHRHGQYSGS